MGLAAVALVPGLAVGSFLNVVAARVPLRRSIVHPGSACMSCSAPLAWYDNVPLLSYVLLRGRCRHCGAAISVRYPAVEALTALLIAGCVLKFGLSWDALIASVLLRLARRRLGDRRRAADHPEPDRPAGRRGRARRQHARPPVGRVGRRRLRRQRVPAARRARLPGRAWAWATSSSRCCSASRSGAPCRSR